MYLVTFESIKVPSPLPSDEELVQNAQTSKLKAYPSALPSELLHAQAKWLRPPSPSLGLPYNALCHRLLAAPPL